MAVDTFIPELWNAQVFTTLAKSLILAQPGVAVNTDYEGDISAAGDTVHIGTLADPTIADYVKNVTSIDPATLTTTDQTLVIDQCKYFAFEIDDVDRRQTINGGALMSAAAQRAAFKLAEATDTFIGGLMVAGAGSTLPTVGTAGTPDSVTPDLVYKAIVALKIALDKKNIPQMGRFLAVSPDVYAFLIQDQRFINAAAYGSNTALVNGEVGRVLGFTVQVSTNIPAGVKTSYMIAGAPQGTTLAQQINKTEAYRPPNSFSDAIKGLHLYGGKVVRPEFLATVQIVTS